MSESANGFIQKYESKFNALADQTRLMILHVLCANKRVCVCELSEIMKLPQPKLSYHLKILLDEDFIKKENEGTWSYYSANREEISKILSRDLCCLFLPDSDCC